LTGSPKLLLRYQVTEIKDGQRELRTETYINCLDKVTTLKMTAYPVSRALDTAA